MKKWLDELNRRNVVRAGIAYVALAWFVLQFADLILENLNTPDWVMQTIMLVSLLGLPVFLALAWAFELTPKGIKTTGEVDASDNISHNSGRVLDRAIIVVLVVALGYFIWERLDPEPDAASSAGDTAANALNKADSRMPVPRSIAVLPFANMAADDNEAWFADGLTEEILNALARVPDLLVAARTSSFAYRDSSESVPAIASALGVANVLEGSVRRGENRLRITVKLIRASDGFTLWADEYDRDYADLISIQEDIATEIARALKTATDPEQLARFISSGTDSIAAYEAYLRGGSAFASAVGEGSEEEVIESMRAHQSAIRLDPSFALPHARLAQFWRNQANTGAVSAGVAGLSREESMANFENYIAKAIELEPSRARGLYYRSLRARSRFEFADAVALLNAYLSEYPNDQRAQIDKMILLMELGQYEEAAEQIWAIEKRGLMDAALMVFSLIAIRYQDDVEQTRRLVELAMQRYPDKDLILYQVHRARLGLGEIDGAGELLPLINASDMPRFAYRLATLRQACAESRLEDAREIYRDALRQDRDNPGRIWLVHSIGGEDELALASLQDFDNEQGLSVLTDRLQYAHFDYRQFPYMLGRIGDNLENRGEPRPLPYRCQPVSNG